jgi:hypothetical protein
MTNSVRCPGCGAIFPRIEGPTHRYLESSPGCWAAYGEVLAREYGDPLLFEQVHRLTVDAYAVQHPGQPSPQSIQSVALHLISLCLLFEHGATPQEATAAIGAGTKTKSRYVWLSPPASLGTLTVAYVQPATEAQAHAESVRRWASAAWSAWSTHHATVRSWLPKFRNA